MRFSRWWRSRSPLAALSRVLALLALLTCAGAAAYGLWRPGAVVADGRFDRGSNAIWLGHGWLGDDAWFRRNPGRRPADFRGADARRELIGAMRRNRLRYLYFHLCPAAHTGEIAPHDPEAAAVLLAECAAAGLEPMAWIGGVNGVSALIAEPAWRAGFVASAARLLEELPDLAGIQVNIEPLPSGDADFLLLLDELRSAMPSGKLLGVAAYPPPTLWHRFPEVHWELDYLREVAVRCDQLAVMMYDTSLTDAKAYMSLTASWTREVLTACAGLPVKVLFGVPTYDDAGSGYHDPGVEEIVGAIRGINAGLGESALDNYAGLAIYCEWETDADEWRAWEREFLGHPPLPKK